ncbi:MAG: protein translocase subunit SecF [Actinomycetota bacterium]|nr:protein translocase subunit SecF [Actinomycetota bacterium]
MLGRLYKGELAFDFFGARRRWFLLSGVLLLLSVGGLLVRGLELSVDFSGGTLVQAPNRSGASVAEYRSALSGLGQSAARVQLVSGGEGVRVQTGTVRPETEAALMERVAATAGVPTTDVSIDTVGPVWGDQITLLAVRALAIFLALAVVFISWRFEWKMAVAALAALAHDLIIPAGIYALAGLEVTPATVIAILTILGYSLYDTVVVFDKMRENVQELGERLPYGDIVNLSMNQVLMRSINTSLSSLLPVGSLLFVGSILLGAGTLREFAVALFLGMLAGTYSSILVAAPLVAIWKEREDRWERLRRRLARQDQADRPVLPRVDRPEPALGRPPGPGSAVPRPPRQRRKKRR